ncbi:Ldh family oxidoreductase [Pikeienuella piscinae]|uniref:Ldh family oxidoreductase n=1 Tax=Pikeienuella piscinae TaxID=2748098 RepID=A0A7L5BYI7_9RHOB|nr:Ldh family oxidoreductase [Pikeienuella piscinae]QIE56193.1 Ldh family oxidoreductase [Pikeienuella piscinae]
MLDAAGVPEGDANLAARTLVRCDTRGFRTHGLARLCDYLKKIAAGEIARETPSPEPPDGPVFTYEAGGALGQVAGPRAVDQALALAATYPVVTCQIQNSAHLGALGVNLLGAADKGCVALMFQATPPVIGAPGAKRPMIGNNPFAMVAPRLGQPPFVVDMACCVAARGNILLATRNDEPIPEGWALDGEGEPTTDAEAALLGSLLPAGGHKGLGLAMMVEILAGSLAGATFRDSLNPGGGIASGGGRLNALVLVFNPDLLQGRAAYDEHVAAWTTHYLAAGGPSARIPGERAQEAEQAAERHGVPLPVAIIEELKAAGAAARIPFPAIERGHLPDQQ